MTTGTPATAESLEHFRAVLEYDQREELIRKGYDPTIHRHASKVVLGRKFAKVDVGDSGRYMVVLATGEIFGIKGYGVIHLGHRYGTLDTVDGWYWGGYTAFMRVPVQIICWDCRATFSVPPISRRQNCPHCKAEIEVKVP